MQFGFERLGAKIEERRSRLLDLFL